MSLLLTAYLWVFFAYMAGSIAWVFLWAAFAPEKRQSRDFPQVHYDIRLLLHRGYDDGFLHVIHEPSERRLQFRKYIHGKGDYGLELLCPRSDWPKRAWMPTQDLAEKQGLSYGWETRRLKGGSHDVLVIDCARDVASAYALAADIWVEVFGLSLKDRFTIERGGEAWLFEQVDGPDHPPPIHEELHTGDKRRINARMRKAGGVSTATALFGGLLAVLLMTGLVWLPIELLLSQGAAPDWSIEIAGLGLGGSTLSLVLFLTLVLVLYAVRRLKIGNEEWRRPYDTWQRRHQQILYGFAVTLPIAVVLVWAGV